MATDAAANRTSASTVSAFLLLTAYRRTQCIAAAVNLGLFDTLASRPATLPELADHTTAYRDHLHRLLRALVAIELLVESADGRYSCTELGSQFTTERLGPAVRLLAGDLEWRAWSRFEGSIRTGERGFDLEYGMRNWEFYATHPDAGAAFDAGMRSLTAPAAAAVVAAHDFSAYGTVADIGGGDGTLLMAVLAANPRVRGILFDRPEVIERAALRLSDAGLGDRSSAVSGDFLEVVPSGADAYMLKWILHDWEDGDAERILANIRSAVRPGAELIVIERVIPERVGPSDLEAVMADLQMMVMNGGVERTESEFRALLRDSGFQLVSVTPTGTPVSVLRASAV